MFKLVSYDRIKQLNSFSAALDYAIDLIPCEHPVEIFEVNEAGEETLVWDRKVLMD